MITERPWGYYEVLNTTDTSQVKRITVLPGQQISLQTHQKRSEYWVIEKGTGVVQLGTLDVKCAPKDAYIVEENMVHRIANTGEENLVFVEVQLGTYFGEDDIVRLEDNYGRADEVTQV